MKLRKELLLYCLVGIVNTAVGLATAYIFLNIFLSTYLISVTASYITGTIVSFFLNKKYTFNNHSDNYFKLFSRFVFAMLPSYVLSYYFGYHIVQMIDKMNVVDHILIDLSKYTTIEMPRLVDNMAVLTSMIIYLILGFSVNKFVIFKQKNKPANE